MYTFNIQYNINNKIYLKKTFIFMFMNIFHLNLSLSVKRKD